MTRPVTLLSAVVVAAAPLAAAAAPPPSAAVRAAFGNTVLAIDPDGRSRKLWLQPDGRWTGLSRRGRDLAGTWTVKGDEVCLKQSKPRLPGSLCERLPTEPGATVATRDPSGKSVRIRLVEGRVTQ